MGGYQHGNIGAVSARGEDIDNILAALVKHIMPGVSRRPTGLGYTVKPFE